MQAEHPTCVVTLSVPPSREPDHFELYLNDNLIQPSTAPPAPPRRMGSRDESPVAAEQSPQLFVIEEAPGAEVSGLVLRVLSVLDEHLEQTQITLSSLVTISSGEAVPPMTNRSFGAAEVVQDFAARQERAKTDLTAQAGSCKCVISLRPHMVLEGLTWSLGPKNQATLAAGTRAPLTVGKMWSEEIDLRVVDGDD
eukprot:2779442-Prymnesium_polylepis.1